MSKIAKYAKREFRLTRPAMASVLTVVPEYSEENVVNRVTMSSFSSPSDLRDSGRLDGV